MLAPASQPSSKQRRTKKAATISSGRDQGYAPTQRRWTPWCCVWSLSSNLNAFARHLHQTLNQQTSVTGSVCDCGCAWKCEKTCLEFRQ